MFFCSKAAVILELVAPTSLWPYAENIKKLFLDNDDTSFSLLSLFSLFFQVMVPLRDRQDLVAMVHPTTLSQGVGQAGGRFFLACFCEERKNKKDIDIVQKQ